MNNSILARNVDQSLNPERSYYLYKCEQCHNTLVSHSSPPNAHSCKNSQNRRFLSDGKLQLLAVSGEIESLLEWQVSILQKVDGDFKGI
jgi:hypothetical protein